MSSSALRWLDSFLSITRTKLITVENWIEFSFVVLAVTVHYSIPSFESSLWIAGKGKWTTCKTGENLTSCIHIHSSVHVLRFFSFFHHSDERCLWASVPGGHSQEQTMPTNYYCPPSRQNSTSEGEVPGWCWHLTGIGCCATCRVVLSADSSSHALTCHNSTVIERTGTPSPLMRRPNQEAVRSYAQFLGMKPTVLLWIGWNNLRNCIDWYFLWIPFIPTENDKCQI